MFENQGSNILLFSLDSGCELLGRVASALGVEAGRHEERRFAGGEHKIRALYPVRNRDVYIIQSLYADAVSSVNDKLVMLLFFIASLRDAGAERVTLITPYLCYARKDQRTKFQDPVSIRYLAQMFEAVGLSRLAVLDVHSIAALENAFRCPTVHLTARQLFVEHLVSLLNNDSLVVASPDVGGIKRAELFRQDLEQRLDRTVTGAFMEKYRSAGVVRGSRVVGEVETGTVVILDDLIAGGETMRRAAEAFMDAGARAVYGVATHGVFTKEAKDNLAIPALNQLITTNSIPKSEPGSVTGRHQVLDISALLAEAIQQLAA